MRYLGSHVSVAGGLINAVKNAEAISANSIQIHPTAPQRWTTKPIDESQIKAFAEALAKSSIKRIVAHGIYLINLARGDKQMFHLSKMSLVAYLNFAASLSDYLYRLDSDIEVLGICFHPGSVQDLSEKASMGRVIYGLDWILDNAPKGKLLLEDSAGSGNILGDKFTEISEMRRKAAQPDRIGFVVDTQHSFASGYDWKNNLEGVIKDIDSTLGLSNVTCIHLNDSLTECGSNKDRHADLGEGLIGKEGIKAIINHPKLREIPMILESPALKTPEGSKSEMKKLLDWATTDA
ncbi:deoxyribonuclease IV [Candidatus Dojkabacteria bacterium]|nr:deoxyribonuclease IV [Candidatus Dojkabacteria bacterium]